VASQEPVRSPDRLVEELTSYVEVLPGGVGRVAAADTVTAYRIE
jgi:hypothetical protein